jgi:Rne/Rng family ribonuclease
MNKELFVSSTPHETKVGLMEDDLLAEIYLERENEYTLAGSIYKGRVTRVLPGMQSAFVDIGLERDAFLYVSDFMELEEHDEDLTDVVPANRGVQDMRVQPRNEPSTAEGQVPVGTQEIGPQTGFEAGSGQNFDETDETQETPAMQASDVAAAGLETSSGGSSPDRERGGYRGRRRRRGGRRDGRGDGRERNLEPRFARPAAETGPPLPPPPAAPRPEESSRTRQFGPSAGYQPILLPGESISKYRGLAQPPAVPEPLVQERSTQDHRGETVAVSRAVAEPVAPLAATFPEDEPIFANDADGGTAQASASAVAAAEIPEEHRNDSRHAQEQEPARSAVSTSMDWNREFRRPDPVTAIVPVAASEPAAAEEFVEEEEDMVVPQTEHSDRPGPAAHEQAAPVFAVPGTLEEETIEEEEVDTVRYEESSDDGYDEFEEETRAAGQSNPEIRREISEVRATVDEIHMSSLAESGIAPAADGNAAEGEEDSEEFELEEAQAEAEAMLDAEARGAGTVDARAEVRAPAGTAGYTQRAPRPRPGYDRQRGGRRGGGRRFPRRQTQEVPKISDLLKEGQEILVQIAKEPIGKKGARITSHIALPGRFLVYMPTVNHTGVSRKIASDEERQRLKRIVMSERENGHGGFIVRTAAMNASEDELRADIRFLKGLWNDIKTRAEASKPPALIYHDLNVVERVLRDQVTSDFSVIWVDTEPEYERILRFFNRFQPGLVKRVKLYTKETPLFEQFGLAEEMNKALKSKVWLKSGGYIVINQTEALVAIDINTGKYVGKTSRLEDTIVKTNVDAIKEIVRQIRLRDLGGIIIIDFIDMDERRNRQRVMQALEEELRHDRAPSKVLQFNDFGLVAITRKRVKQSLERTIGAPCPYCQSTGYVKSLTTVANEIYVEMRKIAKHLEHEDVMLRVNPDVAKELKANNGRLLNEMEELTKRTIIVKSDPALHQEQFDIN